MKYLVIGLLVLVMVGGFIWLRSKEAELNGNIDLVENEMAEEMNENQGISMVESDLSSGAVLVDVHQDAGHHMAMFDGSGFANVVYLYRLEAGGFVETRRMVLLK